MKNRIVDLKKAIPVEHEEIAENKPSVTRNENFFISWSAQEYEKKFRGRNWVLGMGAAALGLVVFGIYARSYFFIAFIVLAFVIFLMYENREPQKFVCTLSGEGLQIGRSKLKFSDFASFWIFKNMEPPQLSVRTNSTIFPFLRVPLAEVDSEKIRMFLLNYVSEEEHADFVSDQIERSW